MFCLGVYVKTDVTSAVDLDLECRLNYRYTRSRGRRMRVFSVFICLQFLHFLNRSHQHQCTETPRNKVCTPGKFSKFTMKWSKSRTPWDFPGQFKPYRKMQQKNTTFLTNSDKKKNRWTKFHVPLIIYMIFWRNSDKFCEEI